MTVGIAAAQANAILNAYARNVAYTQPAAFWVKLHLGDPSTGAANPAANTTRRQATFAAAASGAVSSSADINWPAVPNTEVYSHVSFWDASSAGNFLGSNALAATTAVTAGDNFSILTGQLLINITALAA